MVLSTSSAAQAGGALTQAERTLAAPGTSSLRESCTRACDVAARQTVRADFDVLGSVTTRFD
jgi:hypothetical protein